MTIQLVHVSDIHIGAGESHGRINPSSGLNIRLEDFAAALKKSVDYALEQDVDLYLFSGDAYKTAMPEPIHQKIFAEQVSRLADARIPIILLVGNHDLILKNVGGHAMSVFQSLKVPGLKVFDRPGLITVACKHGPLQIIGLPYVTRHLLMTVDEYQSLPVAELDRIVVDNVRHILEGYYARLDKNIPAILTAHAMVDSARAGVEQELMVGHTFTFPLDVFIHSALDYVALGHVHGHQVLRKADPLIAYAGSIERIDFSEELEPKGFLHVQVERGKADYKFVSCDPRPFQTFVIDVRGKENPSSVIIAAIAGKILPGAVVRIIVKIRQEDLPLLDEELVRASGSQALVLRIRPEVDKPARPVRMPGLDERSVAAPLAALDRFLSEKHPERKEHLMELARQLFKQVQAGGNIQE